MIYDCTLCNTRVNVEPASKQFCTTCRLYYSGVSQDEKNKTVAGADSNGVAIETPKRQVRDMR